MFLIASSDIQGHPVSTASMEHGSTATSLHALAASALLDGSFTSAAAAAPDDDDEASSSQQLPDPPSTNENDDDLDDDADDLAAAPASPQAPQNGERRTILMVGSLRVDMTAFECVLRVRSGCYLLPQAGARAIVVVLEIPPLRPRAVEIEGEEGCPDEHQYVLVEARQEGDGDPSHPKSQHPAIRVFERCLREVVALVDLSGVSRDSVAGSIDGTALRESDQTHLIQFANSIFAECDKLLVNSATRQGGIAPAVASTIREAGNLVCRTLLATSTAAGSGFKMFGQALKGVVAPNAEETAISEGTLRRIETAEWVGDKAIGASEFVVSTTSKAVQYTGKVVSEQILHSGCSRYWGEGAGGVHGAADQNGVFQTAGVLLEAMLTSAVELHMSLRKSTWSLLNGEFPHSTNQNKTRTRLGPSMPTDISDWLTDFPLPPHPSLFALLSLPSLSFLCLLLFCKIDIKETAVDLVEHKYGSDAASATGKSVDAALNIGSATMNAASGFTAAKNASGIAIGVAKESGDQIVSMEAWMGGALQMHGYFESQGTTAQWTQVWGALRPDALAVYTQSDLVQERPAWVVAIKDICKVDREGFDGKGGEGMLGAPRGGRGGCDGGSGLEGLGDGDGGERGQATREGGSYAGGGDLALPAVPSGKAKHCTIHVVTRNHAHWSFRYASQELGREWCEALLRCVRSCPRSKLLGCLVDGEELVSHM